MKLTLLQDLVCPCGGDLELTRVLESESNSSQNPTDIMSGWLRCGKCRENFPIIKGVPRMLLDPLRSTLKREYPEFFSNAVEHSETEPFAGYESKLRTMRSFGYEWRHFSDFRPEGEANFRWYFASYPPESLRGKVLLDVGCGKGRHLFFAAQHAQKLIGVDLSPAVDAAFENTCHLQNVHVVQADLFHLPLRSRSFDMVYSLGVLHHLPEPEAGFREILRYGRLGADVLVYLYWSLNDEPRWKKYLLSLVAMARRVTTRVPFRPLRIFSWCVAVGCEICFVAPYRVLRNTRWKRFAETLPLKLYADFPFRLVYQDQFDRFSAPIENRYDREDVEGWLMRSGVKNWVIIRGSGWRAMGKIPASSTPAEVAESTGNGVDRFFQL
ncbi:MAG: methyltransferase domain-containing protein [Candidatus Sulfotelmatobacter sp.]